MNLCVFHGRARLFSKNPSRSNECTFEESCPMHCCWLSEWNPRMHKLLWVYVCVSPQNQELMEERDLTT